MRQLKTLSNNARQSLNIPLDNGETFTLNLYYYLSQKSWFFDIIYNNYENRGNRLILSPNIIRHLKNILPFGLCVLPDSGVIEPFDISDFSSERIKIYILNEQEIEEIEGQVYAR